MANDLSEHILFNGNGVGTNFGHCNAPAMRNPVLKVKVKVIYNICAYQKERFDLLFFFFFSKKYEHSQRVEHITPLVHYCHPIFKRAYTQTTSIQTNNAWRCPRAIQNIIIGPVHSQRRRKDALRDWKPVTTRAARPNSREPEDKITIILKSQPRI